ncbi:MAG: MBL fold metallo-hydrolase [Bacteroidota bacterium]
MLRIKKFVFSPFLENTYVVFDDLTFETAIIDPGCYDEIEKGILKKFILENNLSVKYIINTHCHLDHIFGNSFCKKLFDCKLMVPEKEMTLLKNLGEQAKFYNLVAEPSPQPDLFINEDISIMIGSSIGRFLFTPGHTPGEHCLYFEKENICFTGDVLFKESVGRTDLIGGDYDALMSSIKSKLFVLPDDVVIYPGHDENSTIGDEKKLNPFFQN